MLTQKRVHELLDYDPVTGIFVWRVDRRVKTGGGVSVKGKQAGRIDRNGYRHIGIDNEHFNAGVVAWVFVTGKMPTNEIDHKNLIRDDNRFVNLREATRSQNMANRIQPLGKTTRFRGVRKTQKSPNAAVRWLARLQVNKKPVYLGYYASEESAAIAYDLAAHEHFGEFATLNFPSSPSRDWILI